MGERAKGVVASVLATLLGAAVLGLVSQALEVARLGERVRALEARVDYFHGSESRDERAGGR